MAALLQHNHNFSSVSSSASELWSDYILLFEPQVKLRFMFSIGFFLCYVQVHLESHICYIYKIHVMITYQDKDKHCVYNTPYLMDLISTCNFMHIGRTTEIVCLAWEYGYRKYRSAYSLNVDTLNTAVPLLSCVLSSQIFPLCITGFYWDYPGWSHLHKPEQKKTDWGTRWKCIN